MCIVTNIGHQNRCGDPDLNTFEIEIRAVGSVGGNPGGSSSGTVLGTWSGSSGSTSLAGQVVNTTAVNVSGSISGSWYSTNINANSLPEDIEFCVRVTDDCGVSNWACTPITANPAMPIAGVNIDNANISSGTVQVCLHAGVVVNGINTPVFLGDILHLVIPEIGVDVKFGISGDICVAGNSAGGYYDDLGVTTWASMVPYLTCPITTSGPTWQNLCFTFNKRAWAEAGNYDTNAAYTELTWDLTVTRGAQSASANDVAQRYSEKLEWCTQFQQVVSDSERTIIFTDGTVMNVTITNVGTTGFRFKSTVGTGCRQGYWIVDWFESPTFPGGTTTVTMDFPGGPIDMFGFKVYDIDCYTGDNEWIENVLPLTDIFTITNNLCNCVAITDGSGNYLGMNHLLQNILGDGVDLDFCFDTVGVSTFNFDYRKQRRGGVIVQDFFRMFYW